ncbi:MAG: DUF3837 domain-containing protein [Blautia sp.]|nr:DUF3837 domain-containing protein [Blautia sp.]
MTPSIARQSVIIKCNLEKSVLLGNYEFYYLGGLMKKLFALEAGAGMSPGELKACIDEALPGLTAGNEKEERLLSMVRDYEPTPECDEAMRELFEWGESEQDLWQIQTTRTK